MEAISETSNRKGMFVLATNELDTNGLSDEDIIKNYKDEGQIPLFLENRTKMQSNVVESEVKKQEKGD